jgi:hypothetical protein
MKAVPKASVRSLASKIQHFIPENTGFAPFISCLLSDILEFALL